MSRLIHICDQLGIAYATPSERRHGSLIEFAGPKFGSDLAAEYDACDGLMLVSHTENFGATVVDAMAYGKPVITSTNTPWKVVRDGGCGWWVKNSPEVLAATFAEFFAKTDEERIEMGRRGRELVEANFTWSAVGKSMLSEYVKLLRGSR